LKSWGGFFDPEKLKNQLEELEKNLQDPDLWKDHKKLNSINKDKISLETKIHEFDVIETKLTDIKDLINISIELGEIDELGNQNSALVEQNSHLENEIKILKSDFIELKNIAGNISSQLDENIYTIKDILDS